MSALWRDAGLLALLLLAALAGRAIDRHIMSRLPEQQPGDAAGLGIGLAAIGCSGVVLVALMCAWGTLALWSWS